MSFWKRKRFGSNGGVSHSSLQDDMDFVAQSGGFDAEYYRRQYPELTGSDRDLLIEYFERGWHQRNPNSWFDSEFYLSVNHDVAEAKINPLLHYLRHGKSEGRSCTPGETAPPTPESPKTEPPPAPAPSDNGGEAIKDLLDYVRTTGAFDERYYAARYPDVPAANVDPLQHYMRTGWREGRDPNQWFETTFYLASNPDVQARGMNPFVHYLRAGKSEGRRPARKHVDYRRALDNLVEFEKHYEQYPDRQVPPVGVDTILEAIRQNLVHERFVIALSHDNYVEVVGGVQICVRDEQKAFQDAGHDYIQLFPYNPKPSLAREPLNRFSVGLNVNGNFIGNFRCTNVLMSFKELMGDSTEAIPSIVIHHLMGFSLSFVGELLDLMRPQQIFFWIHDFFTICPMPSLLRNGVVFCNAPATGSNSCTVCSYGDERKRLTQEVKSFFEKYDIHVIAPSKFALDFWREKSALKHSSAQVRPHCKLVPEAESAKKAVPRAGGPTRIAFLGLSFAQKGWFEWRELSKAFGDTDGLQFFHFGTRTEENAYDEHVPVNVSPTNRSAMIDALLEHEIDVAFLWSNSPETFSFTLHESIAAGCFVLTNTRSGNMQASVKSGLAPGKVFETYDELEQYLESGQLNQDLRAHRDRTPASYKLELLTSHVSDMIAVETRVET